jgi:hypothetical protein
MKKELNQITFDFAGVDEAATMQSVLKPPAIIEIIQPAEAKEPVMRQEIKKDKPVSTRGRRSLKDIGINADLIQIPEDEILFQKQYYSIRYWETEFDILQPSKNRKGDRFFRPVDIKNLVLIYDLLRRRKFTIEGAKDYLKKNKKAEEKFGMIQSLEKIRGFLLELKASL